MKLLIHVTICMMIVLSATCAAAQSDKNDSTEFDFSAELNKVFSTKVIMDIDTALFDSRQGNFYISEANSAMIMTMVIPQSIARVEDDFDKKTKKDDVKIIEKKKFTHNGKIILFQKGLIEKEGQKALIYLYSVEATSESSIFVTGTHKKGDEKKFAPVIERAALSARLQ